MKKKLDHEIAERKRTEEELERRTLLLSTLLDVSNLVSSTMEPKPLLEAILDHLKKIMEYNGAKVFAVQGDQLKLFAHRSSLAQSEEQDYSISIDVTLLGVQVVRNRQPLVISDIHGDEPLAVSFRQSMPDYHERMFKEVKSWMGLPMIVKDKIVGVLALTHSEAGYYDARHVELGMAFANQAALEFENVRLIEQAEEIAVNAERSRIARDLHDAVTQTLFSASLIADVLPKIWNRNAEDGRKRLEELRQLTRGALAEMRTLLFELRPVTLVEAALEDLLKQLAEAVTGRARIPIGLKLVGRAQIPPEVKIAFYRIAQEALNNITKHSGATSAEMTLSNGSESAGSGIVSLRICDNGAGFDPSTITGDHLGLNIMKERAESVGASFEVETCIGNGTEIEIKWQDGGMVNDIH